MNSYDGFQFLDSARIAADKARGIEFSEDGRTLLKYNRELTDRRYTVPTGVTGIGEGAFFCCSDLDDITIPSSVTDIGNTAFMGAKKVTVTPGNRIFAADSRGAVFDLARGILLFFPPDVSGTYTIPNGVTSIGDMAFYECSRLTGVDIPDSVTSIGMHAFDGCAELVDVTIPGTVTDIGSKAFKGCPCEVSVKFDFPDYD